jgi:REP element-mobilizing transposase RayT
MTSPRRRDRTNHRRSIRLSGYDYSLPGAYFVTICAHDRATTFGQIVDGEVQANDAGDMIVGWWQQLERKFHVELDAFVLMPDHVHAVVFILGEDQVRSSDAPNGEPTDGVRAAAQRASLPEVVAWFKTMTTNEYIRGVGTGRWPRFERRLWQRNYYEHIIRNTIALDRIRRYVQANADDVHEARQEDDIISRLIADIGDPHQSTRAGT